MCWVPIADSGYLGNVHVSNHIFGPFPQPVNAGSGMSDLSINLAKTVAVELRFLALP